MILSIIGIIHTPFQRSSGAPVQASLAGGAEGTVEVYEPFSAGLRDLDGFARIWLLYWFDRAALPPESFMVAPYLDHQTRGVFSTRAPSRPNRIGLSPVQLVAIERNILRVRDIDVLDGTPLLDIKPYVPRFDSFPDSRAGWLESVTSGQILADDRFEQK